MRRKKGATNSMGFFRNGKQMITIIIPASQMDAGLKKCQLGIRLLFERGGCIEHGGEESTGTNCSLTESNCTGKHRDAFFLFLL